MGDLFIRVIEAKNLIPADTNGKSDPFVTVEIVEDPLQKKQKTKIHHKVCSLGGVKDTVSFLIDAQSHMESSVQLQSPNTKLQYFIQSMGS